MRTSLCMCLPAAGGHARSTRDDVVFDDSVLIKSGHTVERVDDGAPSSLQVASFRDRTGESPLAPGFLHNAALMEHSWLSEARHPMASGTNTPNTTHIHRLIARNRSPRQVILTVFTPFHSTQWTVESPRRLTTKYKPCDSTVHNAPHNRTVCSKDVNTWI